MASYWRSIPTSESGLAPLAEGKVALARLRNDAGAEVIALVKISGVDDSGNAVGSVIDYVPKNVSVLEDVFYVYLDKVHPIDLAAPKTEKLILRYLDRQGVPWSIQAFHTPKDVVDKDVRATSPSYFDSEGLRVRFFTDTFDDAIKAIDANLLFRERPAFTEADIVKDFPSFKDEVGTEWRVYKLDDPDRGAVGYYAAPNVFGMPVLVGPDKSLTELSRDVRAFMRRGSSLGLSSTTEPTYFAAAADDEGELTPVEPKALEAAPVEESSSGWLWILAGVGALGLLASRRR